MHKQVLLTITDTFRNLWELNETTVSLQCRLNVQIEHWIEEPVK